MRSLMLYISKLVFPLLPETRCFALKRTLLRLSGAVIGKNVRICSSAMIIGSGRLIIGDSTWVGHRAIIAASSCIRIGANVDISPGVYMGNGTHRLTPDDSRIGGIEVAEDISIGDGCWVGANATILPGVHLGEKCVVAAGAVVTKSFDRQKLLAGVPAVIKRNL